MELVTTPTIKNKKIIEYKGLALGQEISMNFGFKLKNYEQVLIDTRALAIEKMINTAKENGANAIVDINVSCTPLGDSSYLITTVQKTAVIIE